MPCRRNIQMYNYVGEAGKVKVILCYNILKEASYIHTHHCTIYSKWLINVIGCTATSQM